MENIFKFTTRWVDCDMNGHMRHSAYYDYGTDARVEFFTKRNLPLSELRKIGYAPILLREECKFMRELLLSQEFTVELYASGESSDSRFFQAMHVFLRDNKRIAVLTTDLAWMEISSRSIARPDEKIIETMQALPKTEDFIEIQAPHK